MRAPASLLAAALALAMGCAQEPPTLRERLPRADWQIASPTLGVGQIAVAERVVVTPPHGLPDPFEAVSPGEGLEILGIDVLPTEQAEQRWVHRTRVRLRGRAAGEYGWPATTLRLNAPGEPERHVELGALRIAVESILPEFADRSAPFGLRRPPPAPAAEGGQVALAAALAALAAAGLLAWLRSTRRAKSRPARPIRRRPAASAPWQAARAAIERAARLGALDPLAASHALSPALRRYAAARYGADTLGRTAEELRAAAPPFAMHSAWPTFAGLVGELDALRFQPEAQVRGRAEAQLPDWLDTARSLVEASVPPEHRS